jgi:phenylacetate-CoA ligase
MKNAVSFYPKPVTKFEMKITPLENWISEKAGISGPLDLPRLQEYQLRQLRETLRYVKANSRFYKERLHDISPDSIQTMSDTAHLPFTYPEDITVRGTDFLCVSPRDIGRIVTLSTSGTTDRPKRIYFTAEDQELTIDFFHHGMTTLTDDTDRVMIFMPGNTEGSIGELLKKGLARFKCDAVIYGPIKNYEDAVTALTNEKATCIVGIPSQVLALSRYNENRLPPQKLQIRSVLLSADYVPHSALESLSQAWGAAVYSHYGMTETGLGGGVECSARSGYHMREADLLFEIIDPVSGLPAEAGEYGEVVFSTLTRRGMPLIRYRTGDRSRFLTQACPCGSVLRRLDHVSGRLKEAVFLRDGASLSITPLDEIVLADQNVLRYSAELIDENGCDCLRVTVQPSNNDFNMEQLSRALKSFLSTDMKQSRLTLQMHIGNVGYFTTGTSKRFIADNRINKTR